MNSRKKIIDIPLTDSFAESNPTYYSPSKMFYGPHLEKFGKENGFLAPGYHSDFVSIYKTDFLTLKEALERADIKFQERNIIHLISKEAIENKAYNESIHKLYGFYELDFSAYFCFSGAFKKEKWMR